LVARSYAKSEESSHYKKITKGKVPSVVRENRTLILSCKSEIEWLGYLLVGLRRHSSPFDQTKSSVIFADSKIKNASL